MAAILSYDIDALITASGKADDDALANTDFGWAKLANAYADTLDGVRAIRSERTAEGAGALAITPEALTTADARSEAYYAVRFTLRPVKTGTVTPANGTTFVRFNSTASVPQGLIHYGLDAVGFGTKHGGGNNQDLAQVSTADAKTVVRYGEDCEVVWLFKRDKVTAANQACALFVNGVCVGVSDGLPSVKAMNFTTGNLLVFAFNASVEWYIHGTLEVWSCADYEAEGVVRQSGPSRRVQALLLASGLVPPGATRTQSGITYTIETQAIGTGSNVGEAAIVATGSSGSSASLVARPAQALDFGDEGFVSATVTQFAGAALATMSATIEADDGTDIVEVRLHPNAGTPTIDYRANGTGAYIEVETTGVQLADLHVIRFTHRDDGTVSVVLKNDDPPSGTGGMTRSFTVATGVTTAFRQVRLNRTGTYLSSTATRWGTVEFDQRPLFDLLDSWGGGDAFSDPINQVANHFIKALVGTVPGEQSGDFGELLGEGENWAFRVSGNGKFATSGRSLAEWLAEDPDLPDHIRGQRVVLGVSAMNTINEEAAAINGGATTYAAALSAQIDLQVSTVRRLLAGGSDVWWVGCLAPPVDIHTAEQGEFVKDLNAGVLAALRALPVPGGSKLVVSDPYTDMLADGIDSQDEADFPWDAGDLHPANSTTARLMVDYAIAGAERILGAREAVGAITGRRRR